MMSFLFNDVIFETFLAILEKTYQILYEPNFIMIEIETTKLGEGLRTLAPGLLPIRWPTQVVTIYANKLANDPFVGLRVAINDVHR